MPVRKSTSVSGAPSSRCRGDSIEILICAQVEDPNDVVDVGQKVYVKVVEHREMDKVSLSMKVVDQATGEDLDPANRDYQARGEGGGGRRGNAPIRAGDEVDPVEAMRKGTADPRNQRFASGGDYELVEDEPAPPPAADVVLGPEIGRGKFARVVRATHGGRVVAAKLPVRNEDDDREEAEVARYLAQEIRMLRGCDHEHVVRFVGVVDGTTLLTELCAGGDLLRLLEGNAELGWPLRLRLAGDACRGLAYLHERGVMHRDVKAENVLLSQDWRGKLCDFGMARGADENSQCKTLCGTPEYMAPELLLGEVEAYGLAADVFSLGCVLVELATREACATCLVREARNMFEVDDDILRAKLAGAPDSFVELAVQCLAGEDYERPLAEDAQAWLEELASEAGAVAAPPAWGALGLDAGRVSGELLLMDAAGRFARRWVVVAGSCVSWTGEAARDAGARDLRAATAVAVEGDDVVLDKTTRFRAADALRRDVWAAALRAAVARAPAGGPGDVAVAVAPLPRFPGYVDVRARRGGLRASRFVAVEAVTTDLDARLGALAEDDAALPRPPAGGGADAAAVEAYLAEVAAAVGGRPRLLEALLEALDLADDGPRVVVGAARPV